MVNARSAKRAASPGMASSGVSRFSVNAVTTAVNAAPMATPMARSMTLPRRMKALKSLSIGSPWSDEPPGDVASDVELAVRALGVLFLAVGHEEPAEQRAQDGAEDHEPNRDD